MYKHHGGKMVPFAGYELPVQYEGMGVLKEHLRKFEGTFFQMRTFYMIIIH